MNYEVKVGASQNTDPMLALTEIKSQIDMPNLKMVVFFASSHYEPSALIEAFNWHFPLSCVIGCSSVSEIISGNMLHKSVVAMGVNQHVFEDVQINVIENMEQFDPSDIKLVVKELKSYYSKPINELDPKRHLGLLFLDGLSHKEELILDEIGEYSNLSFIGGSSSADMAAGHKPVVYANRSFYHDSSLVALIKTGVGFHCDMWHTYVPYSKSAIVATKVDESRRIIHELNSRPAFEVYCQTLGMPAEEAQQHYIEYPIGIYIDNTPFVRSISKVLADGSMVLDSATKPQTKIYVMHALDTAQHLEKSLVALKSRATPLVSLWFSCIGRCLLVEQQNNQHKHTELLSGLPMIGFQTFGESYIGHNNMSATVLTLEQP